MTNSKSTKRALLLSALSILMCVAMLVGTTFAWFTDTASTAVNKIQAGTLDVALEMYDGEKWVNAENKTLDFVKSADAPENEAILWEPGCTYELPALRISNKGNLALKYSIQVTGIDGDAKLLEVIDWTIAYPVPTEDGVATTSLLTTGSNEGYLLPEQTADGLIISGHMQESAGNEYQGLSIDGIAITVYATQYTYEFDSYDNQYDALAPLPWDGKTVTDPVLNAADGKYHITSAAEFAGLMSKTQGGNSPYSDKTFVLDCDIDLGGKTITGVGSAGCNVSFTFDGQGHTVSNFTINNDREDYAGLFNQVSFGGSIKNLKVDNATVIGNKMVGVIASSLDDASIDGCEVTNSTVVAKVKKAGAIAGYTSYGTVTNCKATNVDVYCADASAAESGEIVGYINAGSTLDNNTATDVNVYAGTTVTLISTAEEFTQYINELNNDPSHGAHRYDKAKAVLVADIDLGGAELTASGEGYMFSGSFDGRGHTVSNFTVKRTDGQRFTGLFCVYVQNGTIKNLTVKNATIISNGNQVAAIVPAAYDNATVENCHAINCVTSGVKKVGAVAGLAGNGATIKDCSATGCSVTASNNDVVDANLFGYANGGTFTGNVDNGGNTLSYGG